MGCGVGCLKAMGKTVEGAIEGDVLKAGEGALEIGQVLVEAVGDFWSTAAQAAEAAGGAAEAVGGTGGELLGAGGEALGVAGQALAGGGLDVLQAVPEVLAHVDPFILVVGLDLLCGMYQERQSSGLQQGTHESAFAPIDLSEGARPEPSAGSPGESAIERCCRPLGLQEAAREARGRAETMDAGPLTVDEAGAIHLYTGNVLYRQMNADLRNSDRQKARPYFAYLRLLLGGFDRLSEDQWKRQTATSLELFRGAEGDLSPQYPEGSTVTWWAVSSCTPDLDVASNFAGGTGGTLFRISTQTAIAIQELSAYQNEKELLLAPGTRLRVSKVLRSTGSFAAEVHLAELPGERSISVVVKKSIPETWRNTTTEGHFDQMVEVVPADPAVGAAKRRLFQQILDLSWRRVPTRDRPCPLGRCDPAPGGCEHVRPGADPGMPAGLRVHRVLRFEDSKMWSRYVTRVVEIQERRGGAVQTPLTRTLKQATAWMEHAKDRAALARQSTRGLTVGAFTPLEPDVNEVYLFHGTTAAAAAAISEDGFLLSKAGSNVGTMYGAGVYLAECCSKADEYAKADGDKILRLLMCRACLGRPHVTEARDERAADHFLSGEADSTLGDRESSTGTYREFVVYDTAQVYPEFVIEYKRLGAFYEAKE